ncbi:cobyrinate a,c-diamide synthase [Metabacillus arenae]|uniref:Cobyrinate a,c-diamide synthase n=1 Tax=Metabacillus arenae TaxID=2771434 RepID=A0A926NI61_9BACI|nr:cobyrinate a,c-diamide synthase [Metabacillus arenae]MBD1380453.1 cobyrinate a,c-diamide synthase [Metabacillus arenae]
MSNRRLVIAGTGSGVGKTTVTLGIMAALMKKGYIVQGFKCGPDYIDPAYHTSVTGRPSRNLDSWMLSHETVKEIYTNGSQGADISIIEGVMGFYDGKSPSTNVGSSAEISEITKSPVLLVVDCAAMARSAAAIVKGFQTFNEEANIVGVLANKVGSEGHYKLVQTAIEQECGIPVIGYISSDKDLFIPERHLGLVPSIERGELASFFENLGQIVSNTVNLDLLYKLAEAPELQLSTSKLFVSRPKEDIKIAVAKDAAFNFYYPENLELLEAYGAELVFFSPLNGEPIPKNVDGLYLGGGFPEEFASELASDRKVKDSIRAAIDIGMPTLAECGGFMYLSEKICTTDEESYQMVGVIPGEIKMQKRLAALGYREIAGEDENYLLPEGLIAKGHEFHYSTYETDSTHCYAYQTKGISGTNREGYMKKNLISGYTHFHFASCPEMVTNWITACKEWKSS